MVVSDFDGTLFRSDRTVSQKTKDAINRFVDGGGVFVVSTGRSLQSILPLVRRFGFKGYISCFNGAVIADIETGKRIFERKHTVQDSCDICKILEELGLYMTAFDIEKYYAKVTSPFLENYEKVTETKACVSGKALSEFFKENLVECVKVVAIVEEEKRYEIIEEVKKRVQDRFYITSGGASLVEICPKGVSKGTAVEFLADYYNIPIENVIAVGDSLNDLPMIQTAGLGFAVKNAEEFLKNNVTVYPYTNDENAVARIIEQYALEEI